MTRKGRSETSSIGARRSGRSRTRSPIVIMGGECVALVRDGSNRRGDVRLGEVPSHEEKFVLGDFRDSVGEAIAEIQPRRMPPLTVPLAAFDSSSPVKLPKGNL